MSESTLIVRGIVNLTEREMWVYGTSGELIKLDRVNAKNGKLPDPEEGYYYAVDIRDNICATLEANPDYFGRIVMPKYQGDGRNKTKIYTFYTPRGFKVLPITDDFGREGAIIVKEDNNKKYIRTVCAT